MAAIVGALRANLEAGVGQFKTDMGQAADAVDKTTKRMKASATSASQAGKAFSDFGKIAKSALAFGGAVAIAAFVKDSIKGAVAAEEMRGVLDREFGAMGASVEDWASETGAALGIVDDELKESAASFGNLFEKVVPTQGAAADMSEAMAKLAVDLATFNRIPIEEATGKLQAGLAGSTKALKDFGVLITKEEVAQRAVKMGLAATTKEVSAQDRVLASYNLILEKTGNVQGFTASQLNTTAGKMRAFEASVDTLSDDLGSLLIPVLTTVVGWLDLYSKGIKTILGDTAEFSDGLMVMRLRIAQATGGDVKAIVDEFQKMHTTMNEVGRDAKTNGGIIEEEFEGGAKAASDAAKELRRFSDQAKDSFDDVRAFGIPAWAANEDGMERLNDNFNSLKRNLQNQVSEMKEAESGSVLYAKQIATIEENLEKLKLKYAEASDAAIELFNIQKKSSDANLAVQLGAMKRGSDALAQAGGKAGLMSENQRRVLDLEADLNEERLSGAAALKTLEVQRAEAELANDGAQIIRLDQIIAAQTTYNDLVDATTAKQILGQEMLQQMVDGWRETTSSALADLGKGVRDAGADFDFKEWGANFIRNLSDSVIERKADQLTETLFGFLGLGKKEQKVDTIVATSLKIMGGGIAGGNAFGGFDPGFGAGAGAGDTGGGLLGSALGGLQKFLGSTFGGFFDQGGTLNPGEWGIKSGKAEVLRGGRHGMQVEPMGGGGDVIQSFNITTPNPDGFRQSARQIGQLARRQLS